MIEIQYSTMCSLIPCQRECNKNCFVYDLHGGRRLKNALNELEDEMLKAFKRFVSLVR